MKDSEEVSVTLRLPSGVVRQIKDRAHAHDTTLRSVFLGALKTAGFQVSDSDPSSGSHFRFTLSKTSKPASAKIFPPTLKTIVSGPNGNSSAVPGSDKQ